MEISGGRLVRKESPERLASGKGKEYTVMKHARTLNTPRLKESCAKGGCGECQASCQSACKTSCTVANQKCENKENQ